MRKAFRLAAYAAAVFAIARLSPAVHSQNQSASQQRPNDATVEETRKLIHDVADGLRAKEAPSQSAPKDWKPSRTIWGEPDISGIYSNSDENGIPFERPEEFAGRKLEEVTPAELAKIRETRREQTIERAVELSEMPNPQLFWWETLNAKNSRPWLVQDPPDGKIPPMTADGQRRQAARAEARRLSGRGPADSYEDRSLYDQCISRGLPGSMLPAIYGSSYQIHQSPGVVAIRYEMIHETRIIPIGPAPHVNSHIREYMGDARGHWEGNTLVVETTNFKDQSAYRGADAASLRLIERFTPISPTALQWTVTVDDPHTWARPWTFAMNLTHKDQSQQPFEYGCHEGNYGLRNILSAARSEDRAVENGADKQ